MMTTKYEPARMRVAAVNHGLYGVVPALFTAGLVRLFLSGGGRLFASDFRRSYWPAAQSILHGASPYIDPRFLDLTRDVGFAYPAVGALLIAPFGLLSEPVGGLIFTALNLAAIPIALRLFGVRDWRVYGLVLLWLPVVSAWETANVTLLLVLGISVVWRYRDRPIVSGLVVALLVSVKPITWPLFIWLVGTRRVRASSWAIGFGFVMNAAAWLTLGVDQVHRYSALMDAFASQGERIGFTLVALLMHLGAGSRGAYVVGLIPGLLACVACLVVGMRGRERAAMVLCIAAVLFSTSVVWLHYFALLIVPLALTRPRLSPAWALPMIMWCCLPTNDPAAWQVAASLFATAGVFVVCLRDGNSQVLLIRENLALFRQASVTNLALRS